MPRLFLSVRTSWSETTLLDNASIFFCASSILLSRSKTFPKVFVVSSNPFDKRSSTFVFIKSSLFSIFWFNFSKFSFIFFINWLLFSVITPVSTVLFSLNPIDSFWIALFILSVKSWLFSVWFLDKSWLFIFIVPFIFCPSSLNLKSNFSLFSAKSILILLVPSSKLFFVPKFIDFSISSNFRLFSLIWFDINFSKFSLFFLIKKIIIIAIIAIFIIIASIISIISYFSFF